MGVEFFLSLLNLTPLSQESIGGLEVVTTIVAEAVEREHDHLDF